VFIYLYEYTNVMLSKHYCLRMPDIMVICMIYGYKIEQEGHVFIHSYTGGLANLTLTTTPATTTNNDALFASQFDYEACCLTMKLISANSIKVCTRATQPVFRHHRPGIKPVPIPEFLGVLHSLVCSIWFSP
jgi:hypothetical protein